MVTGKQIVGCGCYAVKPPKTFILCVLSLTLSWHADFDKYRKTKIKTKKFCSQAEKRSGYSLPAALKREKQGLQEPGKERSLWNRLRPYRRQTQPLPYWNWILQALAPMILMTGPVTTVFVYGWLIKRFIRLSIITIPHKQGNHLRQRLYHHHPYP